MKICQCCGALASAEAPHCARCGEASWKAAPSVIVREVVSGDVGKADLYPPAVPRFNFEEALFVPAPPIVEPIVLPPVADEPAPIEDTQDVTPEPVADPAPEAEPIAVDGDLPAMPDAPPIVIDGPGLHMSMPEPVAEVAPEPPAPSPRIPRRNRGNR